MQLICNLTPILCIPPHNESDRERERHKKKKKIMYIYIYIHTHTHCVSMDLLDSNPAQGTCA